MPDQGLAWAPRRHRRSGREPSPLAAHPASQYRCGDGAGIRVLGSGRRHAPRSREPDHTRSQTRVAACNDRGKHPARRPASLLAMARQRLGDPQQRRPDRDGARCERRRRLDCLATERAGRWAVLPLDSDQCRYICRRTRLAGQARAPAATNAESGTAAPPDNIENYVASAAASELSELSAAQEGTRNDTLNRAAFNLAQFVKADALPEDWARGQLEAHAIGAGLSAIEARQTIESAFRAAQPRRLPS